MLQERLREFGQLTHPRALADPFAAFAAVGRDYGHPRRLVPFAEGVERYTLRHERLQVVEPRVLAPHPRPDGRRPLHDLRLFWTTLEEASRVQGAHFRAVVGGHLASCTSRKRWSPG